ncbi:transcription factor PAP1-domain-containing protein [Lipomyces tetrasporus]|uniref:Transcription factor PAP1-domain-containing protein n=1 Tax=Lipomyces tetrasporus TaxID=54092 RepID=A0AAD7QXG1_9ASCO|nr:transcription factor PAP1-domain-containing protein [Lipomyces tetrasporus]KAJ8103273.1 transcription factor PAP1-domain-containing protein [Lipomyces tetrasporus]
MSNTFGNEYFSDDTQRFLAALSSSDFLGDFSSLQNAAGGPGLNSDDANSTGSPFSSVDFGGPELTQMPELLARVPPPADIDQKPSPSSLFSGTRPGSTSTSSATSPTSPLNSLRLTTNTFGTPATSVSATSWQGVSTAPRSSSSSSSRETSPNMQYNGHLSATAELEKRKVGDDLSDDDLSETESKRRDTNTAEPEDGKKKPGRKLMTAEPSSKRKAQNRAAQRAFRERKEKHLRDLEARVAELENDAHSMTTENQFLKKQVDRLQTELKEYRKRQSLSSSAKSSPTAGHNYVTPFTFEFPLFGADPKFAKQSSSAQQGQTKPGQAHPRSAGTSPMASVPFGHSMFTAYSPTSTIASSSSSPSLTATGAPVSAKQSPACPIPKSSLYGNDEDDFCAQLSMACGTRDNPVPKAHSNSVLSPPSFENDLFSEYREPIFNTGGEEFNLPELTPDDVFDNLGDLNDAASGSGSSKDDDMVVPADNKPLMGCTALWDRISMHPKFEDLDIDGLCSELRTKAKCSESGVVVTEADLNAVLKKIDTSA